MPEFECPRCHKNSLPDPQTGYYESGLCSECEEELDKEDRIRNYDPRDQWDTLEEWRGER